MTLTIQIANKHFGKHTVIKDLSLKVAEHEIVALVGPSGAGKSTLLNIVSGLDHNYQGKLVFNNTDIAHAKVGLMFQEARLMPWLTITENVALVSDNKHAKALAQQWLCEVGLENYLDCFPSQLSGGMMKRVALARAFIYAPDILLMDEPFSSLDQPSAETLRGQLLALWEKQRTTIIYVTHDLHEAIAVSDRVILLDSHPMSLIHDHHVNLPRPRAISSQGVAQESESLRSLFPQLLLNMSQTDSKK